MFCSGWGEICNNIDLKEYPIVVACEKEKEIVGKLKKETGAPEFVFIHVPDSWIPKYIGGWKQLGIETVSITHAADTFVYFNAQFSPQYICDVGYVGGYWPFKGRNLDRSLVRLCNEEWNLVDIKVFGGGKWPVFQHLGQINIGEDAKVFNSSMICPNISEPHATDVFPDLVERIWKVPCSKGFLISDNVDLSETELAGIVPQFNCYDSFFSLIKFFLKEENKDERLGLIKKQHNAIMAHGTYFERMNKLLDNVGLKTEAKEILDTKKFLFQTITY